MFNLFTITSHVICQRGLVHKRLVFKNGQDILDIQCINIFMSCLGTNSCKVVYDYYLDRKLLESTSEADLNTFVTESIKASDQVMT